MREGSAVLCRLWRGRHSPTEVLSTNIMSLGHATSRSQKFLEKGIERQIYFDQKQNLWSHYICMVFPKFVGEKKCTIKNHAWFSQFIAAKEICLHSIFHKLYKVPLYIRWHLLNNQRAGEEWCHWMQGASKDKPLWAGTAVADEAHTTVLHRYETPQPSGLVAWSSDGAGSRHMVQIQFTNTPWQYHGNLLFCCLQGPHYSISGTVFWAGQESFLPIQLKL